jgi:hypothetical protein
VGGREGKALAQQCTDVYTFKCSCVILKYKYTRMQFTYEHYDHDNEASKCVCEHTQTNQILSKSSYLYGITSLVQSACYTSSHNGMKMVDLLVTSADETKTLQPLQKTRLSSIYSMKTLC